MFLFEKCAREAASLGGIGHGGRDYFSSGRVSFFEAISGMVFFSKMVPNGASNGFKKLTKSDRKNELETKSTKHVENVLNLDTLGLARNAFSNGKDAKNP